MNTIHIMKKSLYNHLSFIDESWVLYNAFTDEVSVLAPEVKALYEKHDVDEIRKIHPDFTIIYRPSSFLFQKAKTSQASVSPNGIKKTMIRVLSLLP